MEVNLDKLKSRKLWATILTVATIAFNKKYSLGLTAADLSNLAVVIGAYLVGQGIADKK